MAWSRVGLGDSVFVFVWLRDIVGPPFTRMDALSLVLGTTAMSALDLVQTLNQLDHPRALVLGDLILDRYTRGDAERISQEAPVVVLRADESESRLGGAANVCAMLRGLDVTVTCVGVTGDDPMGVELRQLLSHDQVDCTAVVVDAGRPTTTKHRFVGRAGTRHPNQILRVDHESRQPVADEIEQQLAEAVAKQVADHDVLLISDYGKGVCTPGVVQAAIAAAQRSGVPVIVDPAKGVPYERYRGATVIKPNRIETGHYIGRSIDSAADAADAGKQLCEALQIPVAIITLDSDGMMLTTPDDDAVLFPTAARTVYDITGAGDMVLAMLGLGIGSQLDHETTIQLANVACGLEVEKPGVAIVTRDEIRAELLLHGKSEPNKVVSLSEAMAELQPQQQAGRRVVFTNGCFDLLHVGHITYLQEAASLGDLLVVGINSDASVRALKGPDRPVIHERDRAAMLAALACVDYVVVFDEATPHQLLRGLRPDVLVKGGTYTPDEVVGGEIVRAHGGRVCVTGVVNGISTTKIIASVANSSSAKRAPAHRRAG